jgi:branched-chain amino acid transport system permease protein
MSVIAISFASFTHIQFWLSVGVLAAIYGLFALGLQVNIGYTGIYNFGQVGFMAIGAYAMATLVVKAQLSFWAALPIASAITVLFGLALGLVGLRLRSHYFAIATISFAEITRYVIQDLKVTGGTLGVLGFATSWMRISAWMSDRLDLGPSYYLVPLLIVAWAVFILAVVGVRILLLTPWGRVLRGIREDEDAVRALGKNTLVFKMQSLALAAFLGSLAGYLLALNLNYLSPDAFTSDTTFIAYTMLVVAGLGSLVGMIFGALFIEVILEGTRFINLPLADARVAALRFIIVGLVLILGMAFRPQGLFGNRNEMVVGE